MIPKGLADPGWVLAFRKDPAPPICSGGRNRSGRTAANREHRIGRLWRACRRVQPNDRQSAADCHPALARDASRFGWCMLR